jgi:hypothetical protein
MEHHQSRACWLSLLLVVHCVAGDERRERYAGFPKGYCVISLWGGGGGVVFILQC